MKVEIRTNEDMSLYSGGWEGPLPSVGHELRMFGDEFGPSKYTGDHDATVFEVVGIFWDVHVGKWKADRSVRPSVVVFVKLADDEHDTPEFVRRCTCKAPIQTQEGQEGLCDGCRGRIA